MATTPAGAALTDAYRIAQGQVNAQTVARLRQIFPLLDPTDLDGTLDRWLANATRIVEEQHALSTTIARTYLREFQRAELGDLPFSAPAVPGLELEQIRTALTLQGPVRVKAAMTAGTDLVDAFDMAGLTSGRSGGRLALAGARDTVVAYVNDPDSPARGYVRVTSPGACNFCTELAQYSDAAIYGATVNTALWGEFESHDNCNCHPEPAY